MRSINFARTFTALVLVFAIGNVLSAQDATVGSRPRHRRYKFIDLGTLGGPVSYESVNGEGSRILNDSGVIASSADTSTPDPNAPDFCFNFHPDGCFVTHAIRWKHGILTDLGALPGVNSSAAGAINARGWSTGQSENGLFDPVLGFPEIRAVLWKSHEIVDLGTLGGNSSLGIYINDEGQVVGISDNGVPDPFSLFGIGVQMRTFLWEDGVIQDIGTLGGPDALPGVGCNNQRKGFIVGQSYTGFTPNDTTGMPTLDPFLWKNGTMIDLGTLGGTVGFGQCANNQGQVIGQSNLAGDLAFHPFLWERGVLKDLGTLGGDNGTAVWINDAGEVVGDADVPGSETHHAFLWRKGVMTDLGTLGDDSHATAINSKSQVVGYFVISGRTEPPFRHPFIWEKGGPMLDLNTLIPANSGLELVAADNINERGEIVGVGVPARCFPDFCGHLFLLIPCAAGDTQGCEDNRESPNAAVQSNPEPIKISSTPTQARPTPKERLAAWRAQMAQRYHIRSIGAQRN